MEGGFMARSKSGQKRRQTQIRQQQKRRRKRKKRAEKLGVTVFSILPPVISQSSHFA